MPDTIPADRYCKQVDLTHRVSRLKDIYFGALPEVCIERARLVTEYSVANGLLQKDRISILDKARTYRYVLEKREPIVRHAQAYEKGMSRFAFRDAQLFAGSTTAKFKGVPLYPEFLALTLWPELANLPRRARNPYHITEAEVEELNHKIFPHWMENNITELARKRGAPELKLMERLVFFLASKLNCISHTIPDFSQAVRIGLRALIGKATMSGATAKDDDAKMFYAAIVEVLEGIVAHSKNLAAKTEALASAERNPSARKELLDLAAIHRQVPEFPARTFREGLTTVWICWIAAHLENPNVGLSLGRLDQLLYPLYKDDIEKGTIDPAGAVELISCLWLKIGDHVPLIADAGEQLFGGTGSNQAITIGGVDQAGRDAVNDLTYVILRATELMKLRDPNLNARYCSGVNPKEYLRRVCEVNVSTGATPAIHNDKAVIKALTSKGESLEHSRDYGVVGCVEPVSNGRAYTASGALLINLTSALELALFNGRHRHTGLDILISERTGDAATFTSFEELRVAFEKQVRWLVDQATSLNNALGKVHQEFYPTPILSALFEGPMEKAKDVIEGGGVVNASGAAIIGLADVADSLSAIRKVVFEEKTMPFRTFLRLIEQNYEACEPFLTRVKNPAMTPKYGNEDPAAERTVTWLLRLLDRLFTEKENYRGGRYRVGYWTMTNHAGFGRLMPASPNGRKAGENFASGFTPVSGVTPSLTKVLNSVGSQPAICLSNGVALNLKYVPESGDMKTMLDRFAASVEGYFDDAGGKRDGGMEIQFNVTSRDTFLKAVADPDAYRELLVRVSGYTAYFKDLNPQMQKEILDRTEYLLSTGKMVGYGPVPLRGTNG